MSELQIFMRNSVRLDSLSQAGGSLLLTHWKQQVDEIINMSDLDWGDLYAHLFAYMEVYSFALRPEPSINSCTLSATPNE